MEYYEQSTKIFHETKKTAREKVIRIKPPRLILMTKDKEKSKAEP